MDTTQAVRFLNPFRIASLCFILLCSTKGFAHSGGNPSPRLYDDNANSWFIYIGDHLFSERFGVHLEAQWRRTGFVSQPQQLLLRTGINYHPLPNVFITAGYCFVDTYPYGAFPAAVKFPEHRIWQQVQAKTNFGNVEWIGRLRTEQRFIQSPVLDEESNTYKPGESVYSNRFRIMNRLSVPFKGKEIRERSLYITVHDELFINSGHHVAFNFLDQNRATIALGYRIPRLGRLELGYMEQTLFKSDGVRIERNHTLTVALTSNLEFRKRNK